jgi:UDP-N-acetylmuramate dehydrogenase
MRIAAEARPPSLTVRLAEPLARHTAWRTGGTCDVWVVAHDVEGVAEVVSDCRAADWRLTVLGAGTRTVARDGPVTGAVLRLGTGFASLSLDDGRVGAACPLAALVAAAANAGRAGLEPFACGAGTVGASLLFDDGWDQVVESVSVLRRGSAVDVPLDEARRKRPIVLGARLVLPIDDPAKVARRTADFWSRQKPAPCSSWYEAPKKGSLRKLLASARLPMVRLRQVAIPESAPEMLVNLGEGTALDLGLLHKSALDRVSRVQGEDLKSRIRWLGSAGEEHA